MKNQYESASYDKFKRAKALVSRKPLSIAADLLNVALLGFNLAGCSTLAFYDKEQDAPVTAYVEASRPMSFVSQFAAQTASYV